MSSETVNSDDDVIAGRNVIILYLLNAAPKKLPIKERDIINNTETKSTFKKSFEMAKKSLEKTFGICVMEVPNSKSGKRYILCNEFVARSSSLYDVNQKRDLTLLFLILSYIFMSTTPSTEFVTEDELVHFLKGIDIDINGQHDYFGSNLKKLITETFVKQLYLNREKCTDESTAEAKYLYSWGYRATIEFDKRKIFEASCQIMKKPVQSFAYKYQEVFGSEAL